MIRASIDNVYQWYLNTSWKSATMIDSSGNMGHFILPLGSSIMLHSTNIARIFRALICLYINDFTYLKLPICSKLQKIFIVIVKISHTCWWQLDEFHLRPSDPALGRARTMVTRQLTNKNKISTNSLWINWTRLGPI